MTERQLECFVCLAKTLNFGEAAERLHLTQPAVSQQIRALENDLGVMLLARDRKGVSLTPAGATFYADAVDLLGRSRAMCLRAKNNASRCATLRTIYSKMPLYMMPKILRAFSRKHPEVLINLPIQDTSSLPPASFYKQGDIAVAFGDPAKDYGEYEFTPLYSDSFVCVMSREHPMAQRDKLGIDDLRGETLFVIPENMQNDTIRNLQMYIDSRATGNLLIVGNTFFDLAALAGAGYGIAILPRLMPQFGDEAAFVPFDYPERFYLGLFTRRDAPQDVRDFCAIAQEVCNPGDYVVAY